GLVGREPAAVGNEPLHLVAPDGEGTVPPGARQPPFLREREAAPVEDQRPRPVVLRNDVARRRSWDGRRFGGRIGELIDTVKRARRSGKPRGVTAARRGLGGERPAPCLAPVGVAPGLGGAGARGASGV